MPKTVVPKAEWGAPQLDFRADPSLPGRDLSGVHITRDDPNAGGVNLAPQVDAEFHSYDVVGDAKGFDHMSQTAPIAHG